MYRSKYNFKPSPKRHELLETIESTVHKNLQKFEPENPTVTIPYDIRDRHIYVVGMPGQGKSTLLYAIASQDLANKAGMCVLDPKPNGRTEHNLVETLLRHIPKERENDIIYISPLHPIPLDIMNWELEEERQLLADDLRHMFMLLAKEPDAQAQWPSVLKRGIHTLTEAKGASFLDLYEFLTDSNFRTRFLERIPHRPDLIKYWQTIYPKMPPDRTTPILTRFDDYLLVPPLRKMLTYSDKAFSVHKAINEGKVILVHLSGAGHGTADFIGTLFVSRIQQAVFKGIKRNFYLFADEFQNFQTASFIKILPEVRSLGLRLVLAHQYLDQLTLPGLKSAMRIIDNHFILKLSPDDPPSFKHLVPPSADGRVRPEILSNLPPYRALYAIAGRAPEFKTIPKPPPPSTLEELERAERIRIRGIADYPCKTEPPLHTSGDGKPEPQATEANPNPPNDAGGASGSRDPLRPPEQRHSPNPQKAATHQKRHQDHKPEP